ncbi:MAG: hypothetical protein IPK76_17625 [Lewinellaceae bacterium]|nr:hypothetical protein [Lewinellaceae bacterium]
MKKFKLCYPVRRLDNTFVARSFSDIEPAGVWPEESTGLQFRFNYGSFPPDLFMAQFIVEGYANIVDEKRWRSGVVVSDGRCQAIVRRGFSNEYIEIEVVGPEKQRRGYLHELLGVFRELHSPFENLEVTREIPFENVWLNYDHLLTYEEENESYFHPELKKKIPVSEVLDGYSQQGDRDMFGKQLNRIEMKLDMVAEETGFLKQLGKHQSAILQQLNEDDKNEKTSLQQFRTDSTNSPENYLPMTRFYHKCKNSKPSRM